MVTFMKNITLVARSAVLYRDEKLKAANVSGSQARYLLAVSGEEGLSQDALARKLLVNKSNVARQVGALESAGYLRREQSGEDKRVMLVYTTGRGRDLVPVIRAENKRLRAILCEGLSEGEQEELARMLELMVKNARGYVEKLI